MSQTKDVMEWERVIDWLQKRREEREERDLQSILRLENLATWTMFRIVDGVK